VGHAPPFALIEDHLPEKHVQKASQVYCARFDRRLIAISDNYQDEGGDPSQTGKPVALPRC
jgi:hypothetical protein